MKKSLLILTTLALPLVACTSPETTSEPVDAMVSAEETEEELDPNDPNVLVCPVTGAMQRLEPGDEGYHGTADRDDGSY